MVNNWLQPIEGNCAEFLKFFTGSTFVFIVFWPTISRKRTVVSVLRFTVFIKVLIAFFETIALYDEY
jgi:hypothetical protein